MVMPISRLQVIPLVDSSALPRKSQQQRIKEEPWLILLPIENFIKAVRQIWNELCLLKKHKGI